MPIWGSRRNIKIRIWSAFTVHDLVYQFETIWFRARFKSWARIPQISIFYSSWPNEKNPEHIFFLTTFMYRRMLSDAKKTHLTLWVSWAKNSKQSIGQLDSVVSFRSGKKYSKVFFVDDNPMNILIKFGLNSPSSFGKENQNEKSLQTMTKNAKWWKYLISFGSGQLKSNFSNDIKKIYYHTNKQSKNKKPMYHNKYCWFVYKQ